jgi:hypothetical protein
MSQQFLSLLALPAILSATVTANRFVTPAYAQAGADVNTLGVARTGGVLNDKVTVDVLGTACLEVGAAVTAGTTVKSDALGRAIPWVTSGAKVGIALEAATAAGQFIEVLLIPNAV